MFPVKNLLVSRCVGPCPCEGIPGSFPIAEGAVVFRVFIGAWFIRPKVSPSVVSAYAAPQHQAFRRLQLQINIPKTYSVKASVVAQPVPTRHGILPVVKSQRGGARIPAKYIIYRNYRRHPKSK